MAANIATLPPKMAFSRNPVPIRFQAGYLQNFPSAGGFPSNAQFVIDRATVVDDVFNITWGLADINFTFAAVPDDSGTQLPTGDGSNAYVESLVPYLQANALIDRDFILAYLTGTNQITFQSKLKSAKYSFQDTRTVDPVAIFHTIGGDPALKPNYSLYLQVWRKDVADVLLYQRYLQLDYPVSGAISKDIAPVIHSFLDYDIPDMVTVWQPCAKSFMAYYFKYAESYGDTPALRAITKTGLYFAYLGGYSNTALQAIGATANYLQTYLATADYHFQNWFESWPVNNVSVKTNSPAFLYFINTRNIAEVLNLKVIIIFDDGTTATFTVAGGNVDPYNKVSICCGFEALGLANYQTPAKKVAGYQVQIVEASGDQRSVVKTFTINRDYEAYTRYLLYTDSCGNFKVLRLYGKLLLTSDVADSQAMSFAGADTPRVGNITRYNILYQETAAHNTGYVYNRNDFDNLNELLISKKVFRVIDGILIPVIITGKKFDYSADGQNLNGYKLEYTLAYPEKNYTGTSAALAVPKLNTPQTKF